MEQQKHKLVCIMYLGLFSDGKMRVLFLDKEKEKEIMNYLNSSGDIQYMNEPVEVKVSIRYNDEQESTHH